MDKPVRTKIVCTIGPAVSSLEKLRELIRAGMNVARLNFSHGTHAEHLRVIEEIKKARELEDIPLAIMLDTKGPEIRLGKIEGEGIYLPAGHRWHLVAEEVVGNMERVTIRPPFILHKLKPGMRILFDDGYIVAQVIETTGEGVIVEIEIPGTIRSGKGVNVPNENLGLPYVTEKDIEDIKFGCLHDVDMIAASFIRSADQVAAIKELLMDEGKGNILILAKIENEEGIKNFDSIVQIADGVIIARGDLGVEVSQSHVPRLQKMMIRKSTLVGKPTITATQMLESMIYNPRPTRAETSDVANAIYDGTSAVMLSGETAIGKYPIETVKMMRQIIRDTEEDCDFYEFFKRYSAVSYNDVTSSITLSAVNAAYATDAKAIFAFTEGGATARLISRFHPKMPIIAMTSSYKCYHQLSLSWGVVPFFSRKEATLEDAFEVISKFGMESKLVCYGDLVVLTAGSPFGVMGTTNTMMVDHIGDVLVQGHEGTGVRVHGNVAMALRADGQNPWIYRNKLIVLTRCDESCLPLIKEAMGVILQNHIDDVASEKICLQLAKDCHKTAIVRADAAVTTLKEGQLVTIDPDRAQIYKGVK